MPITVAVVGSPVSDDGRGLKHVVIDDGTGVPGFARQ